MGKRVLLVCYSFPPNPGVGGRRWAKISKYLKRLGVTPVVLMKRPDKGAASPWSQDVIGIETIEIKPVYPDILNQNVKSVADKLLYRFCLFLLGLITRSNFYDRTVLMKGAIGRTLKKYLDSYHIPNLIITGAPFSLLYYGAILKKKNPEIYFVADIRDSWLNDNYYGFGLISEKRKLIEKQRLLMVLKYADKIIVPYRFLQEDYAAMGGGERVVLHEHGYDEDIAGFYYQQIHRENKFVNFGSQYFGLETLMNNLCKAIPNAGFKVEFYTSDYKYKSIFEKNSETKDLVNFRQSVSEAEVMKIMKESRAAILFTNEKIKDMISTKYVETAATRTPIVVIGKMGEASNFVEENRLGIFIDETEIAIKFPIIGKLLDELNYNSHFDLTKYSINKQAKEIADWLQ